MSGNQSFLTIEYFRTSKTFDQTDTNRQNEVETVRSFNQKILLFSNKFRRLASCVWGVRTHQCICELGIDMPTRKTFPIVQNRNSKNNQTDYTQRACMQSGRQASMYAHKQKLTFFNSTREGGGSWQKLGIGVALNASFFLSLLISASWLSYKKKSKVDMFKRNQRKFSAQLSYIITLVFACILLSSTSFA